MNGNITHQLTEEFETRRRYYLAIASRISGSEMAEDIVQRVFEVAFEKLNQFTGQSSLSSWLAAITRNAALDWKRRNHSRGMDRTYPLDSFFDWQLGSVLPEQGAEQDAAQMAGRLRFAILSARLNKGEASAINHFLATGENVDTNTWKVRKFRAIQKIRKVMTASENPPLRSTPARW